MCFLSNEKKKKNKSDRLRKTKAQRQQKKENIPKLGKPSRGKRVKRQSRLRRQKGAGEQQLWEEGKRGRKKIRRRTFWATLEKGGGGGGAGKANSVLFKKAEASVWIESGLKGATRGL